MIIGDLNFVRVASAPPKTDSPLIVHANAVLTRLVSGESLQPVPRGYTEILQCLCGVNNQQLPVRPSLHVHWEIPRAHPQKHLFRFGVAESSNHPLILTSFVIIVKRYYERVRPNKRLKLAGHSSPLSAVVPLGNETRRFQPAGHRGRQLSREPLGGTDSGRGGSLQRSRSLLASPRSPLPSLLSKRRDPIDSNRRPELGTRPRTLFAGWFTRQRVGKASSRPRAREAPAGGTRS